MERTLSIVTPEQTTLEWKIAGIGSRAIATLIDACFLLLCYILLFAGLFAASRSGAGRTLALSGMATPANYEIALYILLLVFLPLFYYVLFEGLWGGQTLGKRFTKLRVVSYSGQSISFFSALVRNIVRIVDFLPSGYLIGMVCMLLTKREQRLGDLAAGTVVIIDRQAAFLPHRAASPQRRRRRNKSPRPGAVGAANAVETPVASASVAKQARQLASCCSDRTRELVTAFLDRESRLQDSRRLFLAQRLVQQVIQEGQERMRGRHETLTDWASAQPALEVLKDLDMAWKQTQ
ncbi:MAG: RDD family protein [Bacilli bacterium]